MPKKSQPRRRNKTDKSQEPLSIDTVAQLKALANPLRQQLLDQFSRGPATTKQIATTLGLGRTRLYHHVAKLEEAGLLRLVETRQVRGAMEKYYETAANSMRIDRDAIEGPSAELVQGILTQGVVDSLLNNVRSEVAEHLARDRSKSKKRSGEGAQDVMFAATEIVAPEGDIAAFKEQLLALIEKYSVPEKVSDSPSNLGTKYRVLLGCYPIAPTDDG